MNIRPEELLNGNQKLTLGLIWRIILHFQFSDIPVPLVPMPESTVKTAVRKSTIDHIPSNYRQMLLKWAREQCQHYPGIYIEDFTQSWRNGRAFLAILHRHKFVVFFSSKNDSIIYPLSFSAHNLLISNKCIVLLIERILLKHSNSRRNITELLN